MYEQKQRHGCLTSWLVLVIVANSFTAILYLFAEDSVAKNLSGGAKWVVPALAVIGIGNVVFAIALFRWKKWGFFGLAATAIASVVINISAGLSTTLAIGGLAGLVILYAMLQIGGERKAWTQLE